jgi:hypothetical protein
MDPAIEATPLVATVFAVATENDPFKAFRDFLHAHKISIKSSRILKAATVTDTLVVIEYSFDIGSGTASDLFALRNAAYNWAKSIDLDVAIQRDDVFRRYKRLVVFDMDSTLIKQEVVDEIALYLDSINPEKEVGTKVAVLPMDKEFDIRKLQNRQCQDKSTSKNLCVKGFLF